MMVSLGLSSLSWAPMSSMGDTGGMAGNGVGGWREVGPDEAR